MVTIARLGLIALMLLGAACSEESNDAGMSEPEQNTSGTAENKAAGNNNATAITKSAPPAELKPNYSEIRYLVTYGNASLAQVKQAMTQNEIGELTNTMHALYSMRWHRGVYYLLYDLWHLKKDKYPEFAWQAIESIPVRIALASTISRVQIFDAEEWQDYIRAHKDDEHEFHRAQVVVALGLNGDPQDVDYIKEMAAGDNDYVAQSAISGLAMMEHETARDAMIELQQQFEGQSRADLIQRLLKKAYDWPAVDPAGEAG